MNNGLVPTDWGGFFLAATIAGTVSSGLLALALAGQVRAVDAASGGVARAAEAILLPLTVGLVGVAGLWPADRPALVGIAIAVVGIGGWLAVTSQVVRGGRGSGLPLAGRTPVRLVFGQLTTLAAIAAGVLLAVEAVPGLDPVLLSVGAGLVGGPFLGALLLLDLDRATVAATAPTPPAAPTVRTAPTAPTAPPPASSAGRPVDAASTDTSRIDLPR